MSIRKTVPGFKLQETPSFPDGAPQYEEYCDDSSYALAVMRYQVEWRDLYQCVGCQDAGCPQCAPG